MTTGDATARRLSVFAVGLASMTCLAFLKEGGRANNLISPAIAAFAGCLWASRVDARWDFENVGALAVLIALSPGDLPAYDPAAFEMARHDHAVAKDFLRSEFLARRNPLVHSGTLLYREAGGTGIPKDQLSPAVELFLAKDPAFDAHLARLRHGEYGSIVTPAATFDTTTARGVRLGEMFQDAVRERYCFVYPVDPGGRARPFLDYGEHVVILRRRDYGCEPVPN
jgi:hypothetical protein